MGIYIHTLLYIKCFMYNNAYTANLFSRKLSVYLLMAHESDNYSKTLPIIGLIITLSFDKLMCTQKIFNESLQ